MVTHSPLVVSDGLGREFPITRGARPGRRPMAMFPRRWRRFVRGQPPMVARWLRWTQTCRDLADAREAEAEQLARSMISELRAS